MANKVLIATGEGTDGQVFTSNGAGAAPTFQDAGGGGGAEVSVNAHATSDSSNWSTSSFTTLVLDTETVDVNGEYNNTNGIFTADGDGVRIFNCAIIYQHGANSNNYIKATHNSTDVWGARENKDNNSQKSTITAGFSVNMSDGDTLNFSAKASSGFSKMSGSASDVTLQTRMFVTKI